MSTPKNLIILLDTRRLGATTRMDHTNNTRLGSRGGDFDTPPDEAQAHAESVTRHTPMRCLGSRLAPSMVKARSHWGMILHVPTTPTLVLDASLRVTGRGDGVPVG